MTLDQKLNKKQYNSIWQEYCSFFDMSLSEFMAIQNRLMLEQLELYSNCELGMKIMNGKKPTSIDEFRQIVPLTTYKDYADVLLQHREEALPAKPVVWIETTWEGGRNPIKTAPYTESMISSHKCTLLAGFILSTSTKKGEFSLRYMDKFLYGMAPLPYFTGLLPHVLKDNLTLNYLPPLKQAASMTFGERNREGITLGIKKGVQLFFGMGAIIERISETFMDSGGSSISLKQLFGITPVMAFRLIKAFYNKKINNKKIYPKDIWKLKGIILGGTDAACYKNKIEKDWGVRPLEMFAGTEPTCIGTETWSKDGMVLFPFVCFYEFIPKHEMEKNLADPTYNPKTYLVDEVVAGELYEIVISNFKGGAFARYRVGDMFKCISLRNEKDEIDLPQFIYVDRVPNVIDISGFTRITETTIQEVINISKVDIADWFAAKEYDEQNRSYMHLYVEQGIGAILPKIAQQMIKEHLSIYFRYVDSDYNDLKRMLGMDPMQVTIIPSGSIAEFKATCGHTFHKVNPSPYDVTEIKKIARNKSK